MEIPSRAEIVENQNGIEFRISLNQDLTKKILVWDNDLTLEEGELTSRQMYKKKALKLLITLGFFFQINPLSFSKSLKKMTSHVPKWRLL